jgi:hypothetical protein
MSISMSASKTMGSTCGSSLGAAEATAMEEGPSITISLATRETETFAREQELPIRDLHVQQNMERHAVLRCSGGQAFSTFLFDHPQLLILHPFHFQLHNALLPDPSTRLRANVEPGL